MPMMHREDWINMLNGERALQEKKWGEQNHHPFKWLAILHEETGEAAKAALEKDWTGYVREMVQVMAVALAALESQVRGEWKD
jgi:hypothetical protein